MGVVVPPLPLYPQVTQRCINKTSSNAFSKCSVAWIKGPLLYKEMGKIKDLWAIEKKERFFLALKYLFGQYSKYHRVTLFD